MSKIGSTGPVVPAAPEAEREEPSRAQEFEATLGNAARPCLKKKYRPYSGNSSLVWLQLRVQRIVGVKAGNGDKSSF